MNRRRVTQLRRAILIIFTSCMLFTAIQVIHALAAPDAAHLMIQALLPLLSFDDDGVDDDSPHSARRARRGAIVHRERVVSSPSSRRSPERGERFQKRDEKRIHIRVRKELPDFQSPSSPLVRFPFSDLEVVTNPMEDEDLEILHSRHVPHSPLPEGQPSAIYVKLFTTTLLSALCCCYQYCSSLPFIL